MVFMGAQSHGRAWCTKMPARLRLRRLKARPVALEVVARLPLQHRPGQRVVVVAVRRDGLAKEDLAVAWDTAERDLQAAPQQRPGVAPPVRNSGAGITTASSTSSNDRAPHEMLIVGVSPPGPPPCMLSVGPSSTLKKPLNMTLSTFRPGVLAAKTCVQTWPHAFVIAYSDSPGQPQGRARPTATSQQRGGRPSC